MKRVVVVFSCFFMLSCFDKKEQTLTTDFVKADSVALAPPRVFASQRIIDSFVTVKAELKMGGVVIRYTDNGEEPTKKSKIYKSYFEANKASTYSFKSFHNDWKPSKTTQIKIFEKGILPSSFSWKTFASQSYPGVGAQTLVSNTLASLDFTDNQWLGYDTTAIADLKFRDKKLIKKMSVSYLVDTKSWIFPPEKISVIINETDSISVAIPQLENGDNKKLKAIEIPINKTVENLKIEILNTTIPDWHPGSGTKAWLFMDEWIFN